MTQDAGQKRADRLIAAGKGTCQPWEHEARASAYLAAREAGMPMAQLARELGVESRRLYEWVWRHFPEHYRHRGSPGATAESKVKWAAQPARPPRPCMTCTKPFVSEGPHNRLCGYCRQRASDASPYAPAPGGETGRRVAARRA
jgi:transposase-like protein